MQPKLLAQRPPGIERRPLLTTLSCRAHKYLRKDPGSSLRPMSDTSSCSSSRPPRKSSESGSSRTTTGSSMNLTPSDQLLAYPQSLGTWAQRRQAHRQPEWIQLMPRGLPKPRDSSERKRSHSQQPHLVTINKISIHKGN